MDKLARRSGRLSNTTLTIINRNREPVSPVDRQFRFSLTFGWIETRMGRSRPLCAKRPMIRALNFFLLFSVSFLDYACYRFTQISDRYMIQESLGS